MCAKFLTCEQLSHLGEVNVTYKWSADNHMNINTSKTKEMISDLARISQSIIKAILTADDCPIDRVSAFTLLHTIK